MNRAAISYLLSVVFASALSGLPGFAVLGQTGSHQAGLALGDFEPNVPLVFLEAQEPIVSDPKVPCTMKIVCPQGAAGGNTNRLRGAVRIHGGVSQGFPKKSFGFSLDAPARLLDMRERAHWILNAACIDRSLMRHKLSYDLFRSLSSQGEERFAVGSRFVELFLNGSYQGVYLLMEHVDPRLLGFPAYHSNDLSHACIYKAVDHAANFRRLGHSGYKQTEPDPLAASCWAPLDEFNRFVSAASPTEFFHPQTGIASRLDLDNAIDFHLLLLVTSNSDGVTKNFFLARNRPATGAPHPRFFFVPWDYDGTFGRNWNAAVFPSSAWLSHHLFDRLLAEANYREKFVARWNHLRDHEFSVKTIHGLINANVRILGAAARRNGLRWPTPDGPYPDQLSFEEDLAQMRSWTEARITWLDQEINQRFGAQHP